MLTGRQDGDTPGPVRQKLMDEYNKPDSEVFIFLLTTRAGGVGINLFVSNSDFLQLHMTHARPDRRHSYHP